MQVESFLTGKSFSIDRNINAKAQYPKALIIKIDAHRRILMIKSIVIVDGSRSIQEQLIIVDQSRFKNACKEFGMQTFRAQ
jgi:hypothetical protein